MKKTIYNLNNSFISNSNHHFSYFNESIINKLNLVGVVDSLIKNSTLNFLGENTTSISLDDPESTNNSFCNFSNVIGWIYFISWSLSFYGTLYEIWKNKTATGVSFDFQFLNITGYTAYSIYTIWAYNDSHLGVNDVEIQDCLFGVHSLIISIITILFLQKYYDPQDSNQKLSLGSKLLTFSLWGIFIIILISERILKIYDPTINDEDKTFNFNCIIYLGYVKVIVCFIKYIPQIRLIQKRKTTFGWSLTNVFLDLLGGVLSLIQNFVDTVYACQLIVVSHKRTAYLNLVKYFLSIITIFYDVIFLMQHFIFYHENNTRINEYLEANDFEESSFMTKNLVEEIIKNSSFSDYLNYVNKLLNKNQNSNKLSIKTNKDTNPEMEKYGKKTSSKHGIIRFEKKSSSASNLKQSLKSRMSKNERNEKDKKNSKRKIGFQSIDENEKEDNSSENK